MKALVITPVKDSLETTVRTIEAVSKAQGDFKYIIFNDFSGPETKSFLTGKQPLYGYDLIHLEEFTQTPPPHYRQVLIMGQQMAIQYKVPLILVESDVIIRPSSIEELIHFSETLEKPGLIGLITVDREDNFNFPYSHEKRDDKEWSHTTRSLSFCCTLISPELLGAYNFNNLPEKKDWFDIYISRRSRRLNFNNYLIKKNGVLHLPHSSRPWKQLKYTHPLKYYYYKLIKHRDRI